MLDDIEFNVDELPEQINFGGEQALAVRKFPGGGMDVQALGSFDDVIEWDGIFWFTDAPARLQKLGALRLSAKPVQLTCSFISRMVIVQKFTYDYQNDYYIPYHISLQPLINATFNGAPVQANASNANVANPSFSDTAAYTVTTQPPQTHIFTDKDTLWDLAQVYYGDSRKWAEIALVNNITDPKTVPVGTVLTIPAI